MKKKLYIDIDGVVGDLVASIHSFYPDADLINPYTYNLDKMFSNVDKKIIHMSELYNQAHFKVYPFVSEVLRRLEFLDFEFMFVSARPNIVAPHTLRTLGELCLQSPYEIHHNLYPSKEKLIKIRDDILLNDITHAWILEDSPQFLMDMAGWYLLHPELKPILKTLVYLQPYNYAEQGLFDMLPEFTGVMNWKHIESEVLK